MGGHQATDVLFPGGESGSLTGRERELATIDEAIVPPGGGDPACARVLELTGEPGIGKSRLLGMLRARAGAAGQRVLAGRATLGELPFGVFVDALDDHLATLSTDQLRATGVDIALCASVFPALRAATGQPDGQPPAPYLVHRAVRRLVESLAGASGLTLVLDDLHWADRASVELLDHLVRHPPRGPVLLALAYRPRQAGVALTAALARAAGEGLLTSVRLEPLTFEQSVRLLDPAVSGARHRELHEASGGNPFYLSALAQERRADGETPAPAAFALLTEVSRVSAEAQLVARAAAVVGDPFDAELVAECAELPVVEVLACLDELGTHDLVRPAGAGLRFQFRHPVLRRAVYRSTSQVFRSAAHARAAKTLEQRGAAAAEQARHVERSAHTGDAAAVDVLVQAADEELSRTPAAAAHWLEVALRLLPHGPATSQRRLELALARSRAMALTGDLAASRDILRDVLASMPAEPSAVPRQAAGRCACERPESVAGSGTELGLLTRREAEIAELVARGKSNREIAAKLYVSSRTVETHVSHILAKLGVSTRVAIATALTERR